MRWWQLKKRNADLERELRSDLELEEEEQRESGLSPEEARYAARRAFGNATLIREQTRETWGWTPIERLLQDLRYAVRQLRRSPGFTFVALLIMACGIGASTAVFSIIDSVLLRPYAFRDPGQIVVWREVVQEAVKQYPSVPDNYRHFLYLRSHANTIQDAALIQNASFAVTVGGDHPRIEKGLNVSPNFFSVLGVTPMVGRTFLSEEAQPGKNGVVLISWAAWQNLFHGDPNLVGRTVKIKGQSATVIGILPRSFEFPVINEMRGGASPDQTSPYEVFQPFVPQGDDLTSDDADFAFLAIARLKQGATVGQASTELSGMLSAYSATNHLPIHLSAIVTSLSQEVTANIGKALWLLLAAVLGLLLIACVNLASLQLARAMVLERDNAVRTALGAGRTRLIQAALMEIIVLCLTGGAAGILLALGGIRLFAAIAPENLPRLREIHITWPVLLFACGVSAITALLSGIFPALNSLRSNPQRALQSSSTRVIRVGRASFARRALITFEIACTVVLLIVTGLVVRSFSRVLNQQHDFDAKHVVLAEVDLLSPRYEVANDSGDSARSAFIGRVLDKIRSAPSVEFAAITSTMPLTGDAAVHSIYRPDHPLPEGEVPTANLRNVSPGYFATMQTRLIAGREFTANERSHPQSAIISQTAAQAAWPDSQALGRQFKFDGRIYTVTGIAADARIANLKENIPVVYLPFWHDPPGSVFFLVRTSRTLDEFAPAIRRQVWDVDPEAAIPVIELLDTQMAQSVAPERLQSIVLSSFGIAALVLAILGVYGVLSYSVSLRTPEFGIRVALGSSKVSLIRLVLLEALMPVAGGILLGLLTSLAATRAIRSLLYETSPADPASMGTSVGVLLVATLVAAFLPAYRASRIDPIKVLRSE
jgi:predicted permease